MIKILKKFVDLVWGKTAKNVLELIIFLPVTKKL